MKEQVLKYYFPMIKFVYLLLLLVYFIVSEKSSLSRVGMIFFVLSCSLVCSVVNDLLTSRMLFVLMGELGFTAILLADGGAANLFVSAIVVLDVMVYFRRSLIWYMCPLIGIVWYGGEEITYYAACIFTIIIYVQHHLILQQFADEIQYYEKEESHLKMSLNQAAFLSKKELEQSRLHFENKMLEEKDRISQALHDKLGHSINGSLYQLEASKVLMIKDPSASIKMIQRVIDALRDSMDEIRFMIRNERPARKTAALYQLNQLCKDCQSKYGILASLRIQGSQAKITDEIWEVIVDNAFEAVTNALKYAGCKNITIEIVIFNQVIRCSIADDGNGCAEVIDGMGMQGMKQRVRKIGGSLDVASLSGFTIRMILPLSEHK